MSEANNQPKSDGPEDSHASSDQSMTVREAKEALADESHPRHAEALKHQKELAKRLAPLIENLQQTQNLLETDKSAEELKTALKRLNPSLFAGTDPTNFGFPKVNTQDFGTAESEASETKQLRRWAQDRQEELQRQAEIIAEETARRQELEDQRAQQTIDVLRSVDAYLAQLNEQTASVDKRIDSGNADSKKSSRWTITVGILTLAATVVGIIVTFLLG